jgi:hypothetical protein
MVLYRVFARAGSLFLGANNLASSPASQQDYANLTPYTDASIDHGTVIRARQVTELRRAVNDLCAAMDQANRYTSAQLMESSLRGVNQQVTAANFTSLMADTNALRATLGLSGATFVTPPSTGHTIQAQDMKDLRDALR